MNMVTYTPRIVKLEVGASVGSHTDVLNCKSIKWRKNHTITPQLLPSAKIPQGWLQSHSWIEGEFSIQTTNTIFATYTPEAADATAIPYFMVTVETTAKASVTYTFTGLIISTPERELGTEGEPIFVYKFMANYVTVG